MSTRFEYGKNQFLPLGNGKNRFLPLPITSPFSPVPVLATPISYQLIKRQEFRRNQGLSLDESYESWLLIGAEDSQKIFKGGTLTILNRCQLWEWQEQVLAIIKWQEPVLATWKWQELVLATWKWQELVLAT